LALHSLPVYPILRNRSINGSPILSSCKEPVVSLFSAVRQRMGQCHMSSMFPCQVQRSSL